VFQELHTSHVGGYAGYSQQSFESDVRYQKDANLFSLRIAHAYRLNTMDDKSEEGKVRDGGVILPIIWTPNSSQGKHVWVLDVVYVYRRVKKKKQKAKISTNE
jgi:hypothetical protein